MKFTTRLFFFTLVTSLYVTAQDAPKKTTELKEVTVVTTRKAVEQKADRTIFDFASQSYLNTGSVLEGMKKLPGLIVSDVAGLMYQGKQLDVFMDGRPLNINSTQLNAYLEGMPANAIERIEVITQPGAEFPATSGGAILNIITNRNAKKYLSATYSNSTNFTSYDKLRVKMNNSLLLNAKNKYFGWQLNVGQNYNESAFWNELNKIENNQTALLSKTFADRVNRNTYAKSAITLDIGKDRLLLNYDIGYNDNHSHTIGSGVGFISDDRSKTNFLRQDAVVTYQKKFTGNVKKFEVRFNYNSGNSDFNLDSQLTNSPVLDNGSDQKVYNFKVDYVQPINFLQEGKLSVGGLIEELQYEAQNFDVTNFEYTRKTAAAYAEFQTTYKKFNFIFGTRAENYNITGNTDTDDLIPFKQFRFFPNSTIVYNLSKSINLSGNYNKKITLPSTNLLNPNNTNYQNPNVEYSGNPQLQPAIFDNYEIKFTAFDYAFIGYNWSNISDQVVNRITNENNQVTNTSINVSSLRVHNFNFGLPIPYMLFTNGLAETMKFDFNPDKINFLYAYAGYQLHEIPGISAKGFWIINLRSQLILPKDIKFVTTFNTLTANGNYYYFVFVEAYNMSLDFNFSKKFLNNTLTASVFVDDVFNTNRGEFNSIGTSLFISNKNDTRRFGFSINYKIPTKNKLAKEDGNLLQNEKKEDNSGGTISN
jgi:hypothetical protein